MSRCTAKPGTMLFVCGMSRSGTTLLTTVFDAHPEISMAYELIPPPFSLAELRAAWNDHSSGDEKPLSEVAKSMKSEGMQAEGKFFARVNRAGLGVEDAAAILDQLQNSGIVQVQSVEERLRVAERIARRVHRVHGASYFGFKLNIPSLLSAHAIFNPALYIYILRDPRDVVTSHITRNWDRTVQHVCRAWSNYLRGFEALRDTAGSHCVLVRYEDLVSNPKSTLERLFQSISIPLAPDVFEFFDSKATVHGSGHPESDRVSRDFFTTSIGKWRTTLTDEQNDEVLSVCADGMKRYGYA